MLQVLVARKKQTVFMLVFIRLGKKKSLLLFVQRFMTDLYFVVAGIGAVIFI